jgi:hypothetical protein
MLEAEQQFRRVIGYRDLAKLSVAIERETTATTLLRPQAKRVCRRCRCPSSARGPGFPNSLVNWGYLTRDDRVKCLGG